MRAHGHDPLRSDGVGDRVEDGLAHGLDLDTRGRGGAREGGVAVDRRCRHEEIADELGVKAQGLRDGLRALEQEQPGLGALVLLGQLGRGAHARRARVVDHERHASHARVNGR